MERVDEDPADLANAAPKEDPKTQISSKSKKKKEQQQRRFAQWLVQFHADMEVEWRSKTTVRRGVVKLVTSEKLTVQWRGASQETITAKRRKLRPVPQELQVSAPQCSKIVYTLIYLL